MLPISRKNLIIQGSFNPWPCVATASFPLLGEFMANSYAMAISARPSPSMSAVALEMIPGVSREPVTIRFVQVGFSYHAHVLPPTATMSGFRSPLTSATST